MCFVRLTNDFAQQRAISHHEEREGKGESGETAIEISGRKTRPIVIHPLTRRKKTAFNQSRKQRSILNDYTWAQGKQTFNPLKSVRVATRVENWRDFLRLSTNAPDELIDPVGGGSRIFIATRFHSRARENVQIHSFELSARESCSMLSITPFPCFRLYRRSTSRDSILSGVPKPEPPDTACNAHCNRSRHPTMPMGRIHFSFFPPRAIKTLLPSTLLNVSWRQ